MQTLKQILLCCLLLTTAGWCKAQCPGGDGTTVDITIVNADDLLEKVKCDIVVTCRKAGEAWNDEDVDHFSIGTNCAGVDYLTVTPLPPIYDGLYKYKCSRIKNNKVTLSRKLKKDAIVARFETNGNRTVFR